MKKLIQIFTIVTTLTFGFGLSTVFGQSSSGSLSFSPASVNISNTGITTLSLVYTGTPITAAELHVTVPSNVEIVAFRPGPSLIEIYNSVATAEVHVGSLTSTIQSGATLAYMDVQGVTCGSGGTILFNQTDTLIPDVTLTFSSASYTMNCGGTPTATTTGTRTATLSTLPRTDISDETFWNLVYASVFISGGIAIVYLFKYVISRDGESNASN